MSNDNLSNSINIDLLDEILNSEKVSSKYKGNASQYGGGEKKIIRLFGQ